MKSPYLISFGVFLVLIASLACTKESEEEATRIAGEIETVTEKLHETFFEFEVLGGPETEIFQVENGGMNGIYGFTRDASGDLEEDDQRLFNCIQKVNPGIFQLSKLQSATNTFSRCRGEVSSPYLDEVATVVNRNEAERVLLYEKFYSGELSEEEVELQLIALKATIRVEVLEIKHSYNEDFRSCLHNYIREIQQSINRKQWTTFKGCV